MFKFWYVLKISCIAYCSQKKMIHFHDINSECFDIVNQSLMLEFGIAIKIWMLVWTRKYCHTFSQTLD